MAEFSLVRIGAKTCFTAALFFAALLPMAGAQPVADPVSAAQLAPAGAPNPGNTQVLQELYEGVVANQTITIVAQDFYQYFVTAWRDKPLSERYALSIHERPSARWGSQVWVEYANRKIFQTFLPPARNRIKDLSLEAVELAYQNIVELDVVNLLFKDPDLGPDEFKN
jgi:curli production assembly/transport component CsgE